MVNTPANAPSSPIALGTPYTAEDENEISEPPPNMADLTSSSLAAVPSRLTRMVRSIRPASRAAWIALSCSQAMVSSSAASSGGRTLMVTASSSSIRLMDCGASVGTKSTMVSTGTTTPAGV